MKKRNKYGLTAKREHDLAQQGFSCVVGLDEAGCGALAGPVMAGAVVLAPYTKLPGLNDSKQLSSKKRDVVYRQITERSVYWSVGVVDQKEIDCIGIRPATLLAMQRAVDQITKTDALLVDAWTLPDWLGYQEGIVRGDLSVRSIAAASVIAKVSRDRFMCRQSLLFPQYGFDVHKGYGTRAHVKALTQFGVCALHRKSFAPCQV